MKKLLILFFVCIVGSSFGQSLVKMATAAGTDTYTVTFNPPVTALNDQTVYAIKFTNANTSTTVTLDPSGASVGAIPIKDSEGNDPTVGLIKAGATYFLIYDGSANLRIQGSDAVSSTDTNIYNTNGSLTGARTVTGSSNNLTFNGIGTFAVNSTGMGLYSSGANTISSDNNINLTTLSGDDINLTSNDDLNATIAGEIQIASTGANAVSLSNTVSSMSITGGGNASISTGGTVGATITTASTGSITLNSNSDISLDAADTLKLQAASWKLQGTTGTIGQVPMVQGDGTIQFDDPELSSNLTWITKTSNYTPIASDTLFISPSFKMRSASAISFTVPPFTTTDFNVGTSFLIYNDSTGTLSILEGTDVEFETTAVEPWTLEENEYAVVTKTNETNTWALMMGNPGSANIYNSDGLLNGDRILDGNLQNLAFNNLDGFDLVSGTGAHIDIESFNAGTTSLLNLDGDAGTAGLHANTSLELNAPTITLTDALQQLDTLTQLVSRRVSDGKLFYRDVASIGGGFTNTAANNEIPKSDGTNLDPSGIASPSDGNLDLGLSGTAGTSRTIAAVGSGSNINMIFTAKGTAEMYFNNALTTYFPNTETFRIQGTTNPQLFVGGDGSTNSYVKAGTGTNAQRNGSDFEFVAGIGYPTTGDGNGGSLYFNSGTKRAAGAGTDGVIGFNAQTRHVLWFNGGTNPSSVVNAVATYSTDVSSSAEWFVENEAGVVTQLTEQEQTLNTVIASTGNVTTGEDQLFSYTLPASRLRVDGQSVAGRFSGIVANNANTKTLRLKFGSTTIATRSTTTPTIGQGWTMDWECFRTGAATQRCNITFSGSDGIASSFYTTTTETLSGTVAIVLTGEATATDDIIMHTSKTRFVP